MKPVRLFLSYAREDDEYHQALVTLLRPFERQGVLTVWHDRLLRPGDSWNPEITLELERADMIIFLISPDLMASDFVFDRELPPALVRHAREEVVVIPVIIRPTPLWQETPFGDLHALPQDGLPVADWPSRDHGWKSVAEGLVAETRRLLACARKRTTNGVQASELRDLIERQKQLSQMFTYIRETLDTSAKAVIDSIRDQ